MIGLWPNWDPTCQMGIKEAEPGITNGLHWLGAFLHLLLSPLNALHWPLIHPLGASYGEMSCPRAQQQTRMELDLKHQLFDHCTSRSTSLATVIWQKAKPFSPEFGMVFVKPCHCCVAHSRGSTLSVCSQGTNAEENTNVLLSCFPTPQMRSAAMWRNIHEGVCRNQDGGSRGDVTLT